MLPKLLCCPGAAKLEVTIIYNFMTHVWKTMSCNSKYVDQPLNWMDKATVHIQDAEITVMFKFVPVFVDMGVLPWSWHDVPSDCWTTGISEKLEYDREVRKLAGLNILPTSSFIWDQYNLANLSSRQNQGFPNSNEQNIQKRHTFPALLSTSILKIAICQIYFMKHLLSDLKSPPYLFLRKLEMTICCGRSIWGVQGGYLVL